MRERPSPERNGLAIIRCDWLTSFGSGGSGAAAVPYCSLRRAEARASGSWVRPAPPASAWYSRERLIDICTIPAATGPMIAAASTASRLRLPPKIWAARTR